MAEERIIEHADGTREHIVEKDAPSTTVVERSGGGGGALLLGIVILALVAIGVYYLVSINSQQTQETQAVSEAASTVGQAAQSAGDAVGDAADRVGTENSQ